MQPEPEGDDVSPFSGVLTSELAADTAWCTAHAAQLRSINLPAQLAAPLARKLRLQQFDAGESIAFGWTDGHDTARDSWFVAATRDIQSESDIWVSDHVWLIPNVVDARAQIASTPELATRLWLLLGTAEEGDPEPDADALLALIAPLALPISFATSQGSTRSSKFHYVADEFGSRITLIPVGGGAAPNVCFAAIYDERSQRTYSVVWPCADISDGETFLRVATPSLALIAEGGQDYWQRRFEAEEKFDWYCGWDAIERTVLDTITGVESDGRLTVLVAGNGNSPMPVELEAAVKAQSADGSRLDKECDIIAVDYVESVVDRMRIRYPPDQTSVQWLVGDLTDWSSFDAANLAAHVIVDKGCLDAFLVKRALVCSLLSFLVALQILIDACARWSMCDCT